MLFRSNNWHGHQPGYVRDAFCDAIKPYLDWQPGMPEPKISFEDAHEPRMIPISAACRLVWHCTDVISHIAYEELRDDGGLEIGRQTYAACARAMYATILKRMGQLAMIEN